MRYTYQVKITLLDTNPPIWRTVLVPDTIILDDFHEVIQDVMGWMDCHLHQFIAHEKSYGLLDEEFDFDFEMEDESKYSLSHLLTKEKETLIYEYDFGDCWRHKVLLEKILPYDAKLILPVCIKGKRACPPEDCGGTSGYEELLEIISDQKNPEYEEVLEWIGEDFDPEEFDINEVH